MSVITKIGGIVVMLIGAGILFIDYTIFTAIGALTAWIASSIGVTGYAVIGLQVIGWILTLGVMVGFLCLGGAVIIAGYGILVE